jgi:Leucine-rich repeat (LRR) protein
LNPENKRAHGLIGHQYFMTQEFNKANKVFAECNSQQEDIMPISKKFAELKSDDKALLSIEQLAGLIDDVNDQFKRRHHLCERIVVWHMLARKKGKMDYGPVVEQLVAAWNGGGKGYSWKFNKKEESLKINGTGLKVLCADAEIGSGECLLRFLSIKKIDLSNTKFYRLSDLKGLRTLEELDIRNTLISQLRSLKEIPSLKKLIIGETQFSKKALSFIPEWVEVVSVD